MLEPRDAEFLLPAGDLTETLSFFVETLGFRLMEIYPADDPSVAVIAGHGLRLRLDRACRDAAGTIRIDKNGNGTPLSSNPDLPTLDEKLIAPNGTRIELRVPQPWPDIPANQPTFTIMRAEDDFGVGRAGMQYRDLIPDRFGGRFIASHIRIPNGGPVPDQVHFHRVRFQMIYCRAGWVRVVYEDQTGPFVMRPGDCVLQPPEIRHRVLECSDGLEVIEIGCPAEHPTRMDHDMDLPTQAVLPERSYNGQKFQRHVATKSDFSPWRMEGFVAQDFGLDLATGGIAHAATIRLDPMSNLPTAPLTTEMLGGGEFFFLFVLTGQITLARNTFEAEVLHASDSVTIPPAMPFRFETPSDDFEALIVALP